MKIAFRSRLSVLVLMALFIGLSVTAVVADNTLLSDSVIDHMTNQNYWYQTNGTVTVGQQFGWPEPWHPDDKFSGGRVTDPGEGWFSYKAVDGKVITKVIIDQAPGWQPWAKAQILVNGQWVDVPKDPDLSEAMQYDNQQWKRCVHLIPGGAVEARVYLPPVTDSYVWLPVLGSVEVVVEPAVQNVVSESVVDNLQDNRYWYDTNSNIPSGQRVGYPDPWHSSDLYSARRLQASNGIEAWFSYRAADGKVLNNITIDQVPGWVGPARVQVRSGYAWIDVLKDDTLSTSQQVGGTVWYRTAYPLTGNIQEARVYVPATTNAADYWIPLLATVEVGVSDPVKPLLSESIVDNLQDMRYWMDNSNIVPGKKIGYPEPWHPDDLYSAQRIDKNPSEAWFSYQAVPGKRITSIVIDHVPGWVALPKAQIKVVGTDTWVDVPKDNLQSTTMQIGTTLYHRSVFTIVNGAEEARVYVPSTPDPNNAFLPILSTVEVNVENIPAQVAVDYSDSVVVDGNITDDWSDATWVPINTNYDQYPFSSDGGDVNEAYMAFKWGAGGTKLYTAIKVSDASHALTDTNTRWDARDAVEIYQHTTGTTGTYGQYQEIAQQWTCGIKSSDNKAVWATAGASYTPASTEFKAASSVDGDWLIYEAESTPYQYFAGMWNAANPTDQRVSVVSPLVEGNKINLSAVVVSNTGTGQPPSTTNTPGYVGMASEPLSAGGAWFAYWWNVTVRELVRTGVKGTITLQNYPGSTVGAGATVTITDATNNSETHALVLDASGGYSFKTALSGVCTATAQAPGYIAQSQPVTVTDGQGSVNFTLAQAFSPTAVALTDVKKQSIGSAISTSGVLTAVFGSTIYIESTDRVIGIRVDNSSNITASDLGKAVNVGGTVSADSTTKELFIDAVTVSKTDQSAAVAALGMTNKAIGGGDADQQIGAADSAGLNNIGLLVRTTGLASAGDANGFVIDDGSGVMIKVLLSGAGTTYDGKNVTVTGISSIGANGARVIKARSTGDVIPVVLN